MKDLNLNQDAASIAKEYCKKSNLVTILVVFVVLAVILGYIFTLHFSSSLILIYLLLAIGAIYYKAYHRNQLRFQLKTILYEYCDPEKQMAVFQAVRPHIFGQYLKRELDLDRIQCLVVMERFTKVEEELKKIQEKKLSSASKIFYYNLYSNLYFHQGNAEGIEELKRKIRELEQKRKNKRVSQQLAPTALLLMNTHLAHLEGDTDTEKRNLERILRDASYPFQKVKFHYELGMLEVKLSDNSEAKRNLQYVVDHGKAMVQAQKAEQILSML
ncbi:MAG: hypothetical protein DBX37_04500 [Massilioclostridium sp.]|nr:MAG: hypothetical protein DBX37_04500 [Massilioclostridium sp.]